MTSYLNEEPRNNHSAVSCQFNLFSLSRKNPRPDLRLLLSHPQETMPVVVVGPENSAQVIRCDPYMALVTPDGLFGMHGASFAPRSGNRLLAYLPGER